MSKEIFDFSPQQKKALSLDKVNMLVSAGAGSGKTAVLTERVIRIIKEKNVPLESILVLTFTDLGAQEFRDRIKKELNKNPALAHKVYAVDNADITTFDAYALKLLKKYGYRLNFTSEIINIDEATERVVIKKAFDTLLLKEYENPSTAFQAIAKRFLVDNDDVLFDIISGIIKAANLTLDPKAFFNEFVNKNYSPENFNILTKELDKYVIYLLRSLASQIKQLSDERHLELYEAFLSEYGTVLTFDTYMERKERLSKAARLPKNSRKEFTEDIPIIATMTKLFENLKSLQYLQSTSQMYSVFTKEKQYAEYFISLASEIYDVVKKEKEAMHAFTFSDVARNAFALISLPDIQNELKAQYEYILVDEYQDTSDIQEEFLLKIANNNMYMVGDIKQSIYAFRNANVYIFKDKFNKYNAGKEGRLIVLNDNYRSRNEVLTSINAILSEIMSEDFGGANYKKEHVIGYGNKVYDKHFALGQDVGLKVINYSVSDVAESNVDENGEPLDVLTAIDIETQLLIKDMQSRIESGEMIYDSKKKEMRPLEYRDFAILVSRKTNFPIIEKNFLQAGIPIFLDDDKTDKTDKVFVALLALLELYNGYTKEEMPDYYEFRFAVASFLRSFVNNYSDQALLDLMGDGNSDFSRDPVLSKIKAIACQTKDAPLMEIINTLIVTFDFYGAIYYLGDISQNTLKLTAKLTQIENLAKLGLNLEEILEYLKADNDNDKDISIRRPRLIENAVTLMTIYRSKGLEFPIVYYVDLNQDIYFNEKKEKFKIVAPYGISFPNIIDRPTLNTILTDSVRFREILSERIRLLYVALTRAKELMVVIHSLDAKKDLKEIPFANLKNFKQMLLASPTYRQYLDVVDFTPTSESAPLQAPKYKGKEKLMYVTPQYAFHESEVTLKTREEIDVSPHILNLGTMLHRQIELYDFKSKKLDYVNHKEHREHLKKIFSLPFFVTATNDNVYREYSYFDAESNNTYIIDFFILGARSITLIDFKLLNIDVPEYDAQVKRYAKHLQKVFNKKVDAYLLSIINKNWRKVALDE